MAVISSSLAKKSASASGSLKHNGPSRLHTILENAVIRDRLMDALLPSDATNLYQTSKQLLPESERKIHTNVFKLVVPNRAWLIKMFDRGYNFTLISHKLGRMATKLKAQKHSDSPRHHQNERSYDVALLVTKNGSFIPCTKELMPSWLFQMGRDDLVLEREVNHSGQEWRFVDLRRRMGVCMTIFCATQDQDTWFDQLQIPFSPEFRSLELLQWRLQTPCGGETLCEEYFGQYSRFSKDQVEILEIERLEGTPDQDKIALCVTHYQRPIAQISR